MWKDLSKKSANLTPEEVWFFFPIRRLMKTVAFPVQILMFRRLRNIITDAYNLSLDYLSTNNNEIQTIYTFNHDNPQLKNLFGCQTKDKSRQVG